MIHNNDNIVTNEQGGSQSRLDFDFTQLDADMLTRVARVLHVGAQKYGEKNWQKIPTKDHINHMIYHAIMANTSDTSEDHLANVICRAMFAMWSQNNDTLSRLEYSIYSPGIKKALTGELLQVTEPPFGYRKFDTYPQHVSWCQHCAHDKDSHLVTPNIDGHVLVCAKCECRQQLAQGEEWCPNCKHPFSHHQLWGDIPPVPYMGKHPYKCDDCNCWYTKFDPSIEATVDQGTE